VIKSLAIIACVAGVMLVAGAGANACGEEFLASPTPLQSETSGPEPAPKDVSTVQQAGK
jgi:hypothetical protein